MQQQPRQELVLIASAATVVKPDLVAAAGPDARAIPIGPGVTHATNHSDPVVRSAGAIEASLRHDRPPDDANYPPSEERPLLVQQEPRREPAPIVSATTVAGSVVNERFVAGRASMERTPKSSASRMRKLPA